MKVEERNYIAATRRLGMSPEAREQLKEFDNAALWRATCRKCKAELRGTLATMRTHRCENG